MCSDVPLDYPRVGGPSTVRTGCAPRTIRRGNTQGPPKSTVDHPRLIHGKCVGISKSKSRCVNMAFRCADCESVHDLPTKLCQIIVATPVCRNHLQAMRWYRHGAKCRQGAKMDRSLGVGARLPTAHRGRGVQTVRTTAMGQPAHVQTPWPGDDPARDPVSSNCSAKVKQSYLSSSMFIARGRSGRHMLLLARV